MRSLTSITLNSFSLAVCPSINCLIAKRCPGSHCNGCHVDVASALSSVVAIETNRIIYQKKTNWKAFPSYELTKKVFFSFNRTCSHFKYCWMAKILYCEKCACNSTELYTQKGKNNLTVVAYNEWTTAQWHVSMVMSKTHSSTAIMLCSYWAKLISLFSLLLCTRE